MRRLFPCLLIAAACSASFATPSTSSHRHVSESGRFQSWLEADWEDTLKREPFLATAIGDARYNARIVNTTTAAWRAENRRHTEQRLQALKRFKRSALPHADQLSYDILKLDLESALEDERFPDWMQPLNQFGSFPSSLAQMGSGSSIQPFRSLKDYEDWYRRLAGSVALLDGSIANLRIGLGQGVTPPRPVMEKVLPQLATLIVKDPEQSLFWTPLKTFPDSIASADRARLSAKFRRLIGEQITPAYQRLHDFVRDDYIPKARSSTGWSDLPDGRAWYAQLVKERTTTDLTPEAIHELGLREVKRILGEMDAVRREVKFEGTLPAFFQHLQDDPRFYYSKPEDLLAGYHALHQRINSLLPKLFDIAPKADYEVREVEAFRAESAAGGSYQAPAADGSRPGVFYVNTFNLKAQPIFGMETLSLHEASPGHHFQIAIAQEVQGLPKFRRFGTSYVAYSEGWALYAESIGKELGLFTDPYQWYGRLSDEQLRAMRLVVDTGLHSKGWTREQAVRYMLDNSSMAESDVRAEVDRYIVMPAQALGYKIGQLEITQLRREAEAALGPRFDVKAFHRLVLCDGALPMQVLRQQVKDWVAAQKSLKPPRRD